jgi:DNA-binding PucR family transcriptional regulator
VLGADGVVVCDEQLLPLLVHRDAGLLEEVRGSALGPLLGLRKSARERLLSTLRAYLDHEGRMELTANALGVHPQTVRYRVGQLRELLGDRLETADGRLLLALALRGEDAVRPA